MLMLKKIYKNQSKTHYSEKSKDQLFLLVISLHMRDILVFHSIAINDDLKVVPSMGHLSEGNNT